MLTIFCLSIQKFRDLSNITSELYVYSERVQILGTIYKFLKINLEISSKFQNKKRLNVFDI